MFFDPFLWDLTHFNKKREWRTQSGKCWSKTMLGLARVQKCSFGALGAWVTRSSPELLPNLVCLARWQFLRGATVWNWLVKIAGRLRGMEAIRWRQKIFSFLINSLFGRNDEALPLPRKTIMAMVNSKKLIEQRRHVEIYDFVKTKKVFGDRWLN